MSKPRLGIQLIIFRERGQQDLPGVLRDVARAGYDGVETGNLFQSRSPEEIQALFKETGLALTGAHAGSSMGRLTRPTVHRSSSHATPEQAKLPSRQSTKTCSPTTPSSTCHRPCVSSTRARDGYQNRCTNPPSNASSWSAWPSIISVRGWAPGAGKIES